MACVTKKKGRWAVDFYDQQGRRRLKMLPRGATKTQAKKLLREIEEQVDKRIFLPTKNIPIFSEVAKNWLEYKKPNLRGSTWSVYEGHTRNHFHDLAHLKVNRITVARIEKFIIDRQKQGMNILTLRKILVTFGQIMAYSVRHKYIDHNPFHDAERPRGRGGAKTQTIRILTPVEINALLETVSNQKYRTLFMLTIFSGARQGELLGLRWSDVDWFNNQIHIQRTYNNQSWYDVKTETSNRKIDLGPAMMTELKKWKLACPPCDLDLVFPNEAGGPINHNNMCYRYFEPSLKKAGIGKVRFHDLRHTYASLLIEQGENIKYIQSQLGHSSPTVTLNVYAHLMKPVNQEAACRLEKAIFEINGDQMETKTKKRLGYEP
jgi:integrase